MTTPTDASDDPIRCAGCGAESTKSIVADTGYTCPRCEIGLAHLDTAPNGTLRGVIGWLRAPGDVLKDRYRIAKLLGRGGFAVTYLVEDLLLNGKRRALKEVPEILFDESEAGILSRIHHPAVPDIIDRFQLEGMVYLVLEFGGDRTLESVRRAEGGRVPLARVAPWADQLCDVLAYLHSQDPPIVHRDLKPENILLDERDRIMIIDFGIAKEATADGVTRTVARSVSHGFGPPEQALGTGTDERSDVYSLAATLYALLAGKPPPAAHERVSGAEVAPPSAGNPEVGPALEASLLRALSLNVLQRQASIDELRRDLVAAFGTAAGARAPATSASTTVSIDQIGGVASAPVTGTGPGVTTGSGVAGAVAAPARPRAGPWLATGGVLLVLAAGGLAWMLLGRDAERAADEAGAVAEGAPEAPASPTTGSGTAAAGATPPAVSQGSALDEFEKHRVSGSSEPPPAGTAAKKNAPSASLMAGTGKKPPDPPAPKSAPATPATKAPPPEPEKKLDWGKPRTVEIRRTR